MVSKRKLAAIMFIELLNSPIPKAIVLEFDALSSDDKNIDE